MFVHRTSLKQRLSPEQYHRPEALNAELEKVLRPSWSFAALKNDVPNSGDYKAFDRFGVPVLLWNDNGTLRAFKNVCLHRFAQIVPNGCGKAETLACRYHGWEYSPQGGLLKITDAPCFKKVQLERRSLDSLGVEMIGSLIFICEDLAAPSLRGQLGELAAELDHFYSEVEVVWTHTAQRRVNWKIPVENAVESYHVPFVHPTTFVSFRDESLHGHRIQSLFSSYKDLLPFSARITDRIYLWISKTVLDGPSLERFTHSHIFPNSLFYYGDLFRSIQWVEPVNAEEMKIRTLGLRPRNLRFAAAGWLLLQVFLIPYLRFAKKILEEDAGITLSVQKGVRHAGNRPSVLSMREERVFAFQSFIREKLGTDSNSEPLRPSLNENAPAP